MRARTGTRQVQERSADRGEQMRTKQHVVRFAEKAAQGDEQPRQEKMPAADNVHKKGSDKYVHPRIRKSVRAAELTLRLRLSSNFHFDRAEIGFLCLRSPGPTTTGRSHRKSCQSPRIQRRRRATSAR